MIGTTLSHYRILEPLGAGGMGEVFLAHDTKLKRKVALKVLPPEMAAHAERRERFGREATALAALNHPNIVTVYSVEEAGGLHFFTMELVLGQTLAELIPARGLPLDRFFALAVPIAEALSAAHARGVTHRDVKPGNVMVSEESRVKVLDFGLAKVRSTGSGDVDATTMSGSAPLTESGLVMGTLPYMSPEQVQGKATDTRTDVFSLGVVLYEMATGQRPFRGDSSADLAVSILTATPISVTELKSEAPQHLGRIVRRCLEKDPERRYQSAKEVRNELEDLRSETEHSPLRRPRHGWPLCRRPRSAVAALVAATVALAAIIAVAAVSLRQEGQDAAPPTASPLLTVLSLANQTGDPARDHLGETLAAGLLADLGQIAGLRLVTPPSAGSGSADDAGVEARRLGAQLLLGGEVQDELGRLRVNVRIVEASSRVVLWSHVSRADPAELFHMQREITRGVTDFLSIPLSSSERRRLGEDRTRSLEAFARYVEGRRQLMIAADPERAVDLFAQAIAEDPDFALAHAALGEAQWLVYERTKDPERLRAAREAVARARALDRDLPQAILAGFLVDASSGRLETGAEFEQALSRHQHPAEASRQLSLSYEKAGNLAEAERLLRAATALDPYDWFNWSWLGVFLLRHRGADLARGALEQADDLAPPQEWRPHSLLGAAALQQGRFEEAITILEGLPTPITDAAAASNLATAYYYSRREDKWERAEEYYRAALQLSPENAVYHGNLADLHAELGRAAESTAGYRRAWELSRLEAEASPGDLEAQLRAALYAAKAQECASALGPVREMWNRSPESSRELHEMALVFALCRQRAEALAALKAAVERGFRPELLGAEAELEWLRQDPLFPRSPGPEPGGAGRV